MPVSPFSLKSDRDPDGAGNRRPNATTRVFDSSASQRALPTNPAAPVIATQGVFESFKSGSDHRSKRRRNPVYEGAAKLDRDLCSAANLSAEHSKRESIFQNVRWGQSRLVIARLRIRRGVSNIALRDINRGQQDPPFSGEPRDHEARARHSERAQSGGSNDTGLILFREPVEEIGEVHTSDLASGASKSLEHHGTL